MYLPGRSSQPLTPARPLPPTQRSLDEIPHDGEVELSILSLFSDTQKISTLKPLDDKKNSF